MRRRAERAARYNTGRWVSPCDYPASSSFSSLPAQPQACQTAFSIRHGQVVVHVHNNRDLDQALDALAKQAGSGKFSISQRAVYSAASCLHSTANVDPVVQKQAFSPGLFANVAFIILNLLNGFSGVPFTDLRPAMLACRSRLSTESVKYINSLNESYKFARHFSTIQASNMASRIRAELNVHGWLAASGLSTSPVRTKPKAPDRPLACGSLFRKRFR